MERGAGEYVGGFGEVKSKYNNVKGLYGGVGMALKTGMADVSQTVRVRSHLHRYMGPIRSLDEYATPPGPVRVLMRDGVWLVPEEERPKLPVVTTGRAGGKG